MERERPVPLGGLWAVSTVSLRVSHPSRRTMEALQVLTPLPAGEELNPLPPPLTFTGSWYPHPSGMCMYVCGDGAGGLSLLQTKARFAFSCPAQHHPALKYLCELRCSALAFSSASSQTVHHGGVVAIFVQLCCCVKQNTAKKVCSVMLQAPRSINAVGRAVGSLGVRASVSLPDGQIGDFSVRPVTGEGVS